MLFYLQGDSKAGWQGKGLITGILMLHPISMIININHLVILLMVSLRSRLI